MRVAVVHDWLVTFGGAERVLAEILAMFPAAKLFSVIDYLGDADRERLGGQAAETTFIQKLPFARRAYRQYLPLMPLAIEQLDLRGFDLVISSSFAVAKGVITGPDQLHLSYVHSPMRYAWDMQTAYLEASNSTRGLKGIAARYCLHRLRSWDFRSAALIDRIAVNSRYIARRVAKYYRRGATVIHPPVHLFDTPANSNKDDYYVTVSRLVPYKRVDLIAATFAGLPGKRLKVIGDGPEARRLRRHAPPNVEFLGFVPDAEVRNIIGRARAFIFMAEEDFGIAPVEAQMAGTPVIAFGRGGCTETIRNLGHTAPTGVLFNEQTAASLTGALNLFERYHAHITPEACRTNAERFSEFNFRRQFSEWVAREWESFIRREMRPALVSNGASATW